MSRCSIGKRVLPPRDDCVQEAPARTGQTALGNSPGEQPWEFVYFLTDLEPIQISILDYNQVAGYNPANIVQSFTVHYPELSARIIEELGLESSTGSVLTSVRDVEAAKEAFKHLGDELDVPAAVKRRKEQALLRTILLSNKASECCALCGRDLPVDLLVIGHIRKRHSCPPGMKKDLANVMPVCLLGCDRLFENGYVFIDSTGTIQQGPALKIVPSIQGLYPASLAGSASPGKRMPFLTSSGTETTTITTRNGQGDIPWQKELRASFVGLKVFLRNRSPEMRLPRF
ncbi:hypothetical protein AAIP21_27895 [Pseudomonas aeruginosa]